MVWLRLGDCCNVLLGYFLVSTSTACLLASSLFLVEGQPTISDVDVAFEAHKKNVKAPKKYELRYAQSTQKVNLLKMY